MLAAAAGLVIARPDPDPGIDFFFRHAGARGTPSGIGIDVQVKSWRAPVGRGSHWSYRLAAASFNDLAGAGFEVPRFLFVVIVPENLSEYVMAGDQALRLHRAGRARMGVS